jgi:glycosyltransferase involved in cell wall biosynthesis
MESTIGRCVTSLQKQDYPDIEIILVDDGSKDGTLKKCKRISENDSRVRIIHTENRGSGPARNSGIKVAMGRYAYFPDADDYLEPNAISIMVAAMEKGKFDLVVFGFRNVNKKGITLEEKSYKESDQDAITIRKHYQKYMGYVSEWGIQGAPWNKFFDLKVIQENNLEYPPLRRHQDEGFIGRYMCYATRVHFIEDILYTYYVNDLKKEWQKYPVDYIDAVIGLNAIRQETIYLWNPNDRATHDLLDNEYICNVIKALELSFSPKMKLCKTQRLAWIKNQIERSKINNVTIPNITGKYQRIALGLIKANKFNMLYFFFKVKTSIEKTGVYASIRKTS